MPKTRLGKWSVGLIVVFFIFWGLLILLATLGQRGGKTFTDNLWLAIPGFVAGLAAISSFIVGLISIVKNKERAVLVFLSALIGLLVLIFVLGEILWSH